MTGFLGIDHPLILVRNLDDAIAKFASIGFTMAPQSRHPWGTSTCIAILERSLVELVSICDEEKLDLFPAGDFRFGRFVQRHLAEREGISLTALYSDDANGDAAAVVRRGIDCQGTIEFGRDVVRHDGVPDRTATTLKILASDDYPRLSHFICQQHRPDLIYVPRWSDHANTAQHYAQVTVMAAAEDQPGVRARLARLYGEDAIFTLPDGFGARTGQGSYVVTDRRGIEARYGTLPSALAAQKQPCSVAIHVKVRDLDRARAVLSENGIAHRAFDAEVRLADAGAFGNVFVNFTASGTPV